MIIINNSTITIVLEIDYKNVYNFSRPETNTSGSVAACSWTGSLSRLI